MIFQPSSGKSSRFLTKPTVSYAVLHPPATDREIDRIVCAFYGLTEEEIAVSWRGGAKGEDASTISPHRCTGGSIWRPSTSGPKDLNLYSRNRWFLSTFESTGRYGDRKLLTSAVSAVRRQPACFVGSPKNIPNLNRLAYGAELAMSGKTLWYERMHAIMNAFITAKLCYERAHNAFIYALLWLPPPRSMRV